ncbi:MAG: hypothetical protein R3175_17100 [Marinobacter sp.]|nr:hypothetical protein [Marinobacter sp.]
MAALTREALLASPTVLPGGGSFPPYRQNHQGARPIIRQISTTILQA